MKSIHPAVARLLRRLFSTVAVASTINDAHALKATRLPTYEPEHDATNLEETGHYPTAKLIYGKARAGQPELLAHRSHSSHSSHASHYSGSGSGASTPSSGYTPAPARPAPDASPTPTPPPQKSTITVKQPTNPPAPPSAAADEKMGLVLKKLPRLRSKWPAEVRLVRKTQFNLYDNDRQIGIITLNDGTKINLVDIRPEHMLIRVAGAESPVPVANTDIVEKMGGVDAILALAEDGAKPPPAKK